MRRVVLHGLLSLDGVAEDGDEGSWRSGGCLLLGYRARR